MELSIDTNNYIPSLDAEKAQALARRKPGGGEKERAAAKKAAQEFESLFIGMMLKSMRSTVGKDELTGGGQGEEIYRSLLDQEYAVSAAKRGGVGLARIIERELIRQSGAQEKIPAGQVAHGTGLSARVEDREGSHED